LTTADQECPSKGISIQLRRFAYCGTCCDFSSNNSHTVHGACDSSLLPSLRTPEMICCSQGKRRSSASLHHSEMTLYFCEVYVMRLYYIESCCYVCMQKAQIGLLMGLHCVQFLYSLQMQSRR